MRQSLEANFTCTLPSGKKEFYKFIKPLHQAEATASTDEHIIREVALFAVEFAAADGQEEIAKEVVIKQYLCEEDAEHEFDIYKRIYPSHFAGYLGSLDIDGGCYHRIALEYITGVTLSTQVSKLFHIQQQEPGDTAEGDKTYEIELVGGLLHDICGSIAKLHAAGILHCDIKPSNIIISIDGV